MVDNHIQLLREIYGAPEIFKRTEYDIDVSKAALWSLGQTYYFCLRRSFIIANLFKSSMYYDKKTEYMTEEWFDGVYDFIVSDELDQADIDDEITEISNFYPDQIEFKNFLYNVCQIDGRKRDNVKDHLKRLEGLVKM